MCGILGVIKQEETINFDNFKKVNKFQSHRGPDEEGFWLSENRQIALGHRRLSIIDLKHGRQPIVNNNMGLAIVYNGEIYNYKELRKSLGSKGYSFITSSDTEVILASYSYWGKDCLSHFRGMFAFAIVDNRKKEIFLARDQIGIKPLVYYSDNHIFCFASEIKALTLIKNIDLKLEYQAIDMYLWLQYIPAPKTVFTGIKKLEPGHYMTVGFDGTIKSYEKYWRPVFKTDNTKSFTQWSEEFDNTLRQSVKYHTVADVTYGAFLSGGLDSSLIVKYLVDLGISEIKTFSIGFNEPDFNELEYSRIASKKFETDHYYQVIASDDYLSVFEMLVGAYGEPFGDSSAVPTYYVSRLASEHVKVVLSGDGGDELFGGYNSYILWQNLTKKKDNRPWYLNWIRFWLSLYMPKVFVPEKHNLAGWLNLVAYYNYRQRSKLWKDDYRRFINTKYTFFDSYIDDFRKYPLVQKAQLFDLVNYLPYDILVKVDIASMMNGLESRVPFVDKEVIEMTLSIPEKINFEKKWAWEGKLLMKKILQKDFSHDYIYRQKQGFGVPLAVWFAENGPLYNEPYMRLLNSRSKIFQEVFNIDSVYNLLSRGEHNKTYLLLFLEEWFYQFENLKGRLKV